MQCRIFYPSASVIDSFASRSHVDNFFFFLVVLPAAATSVFVVTIADPFLASWCYSSLLLLSSNFVEKEITSSSSLPYFQIRNHFFLIIVLEITNNRRHCIENGLSIITFRSSSLKLK